MYTLANRPYVLNSGHRFSLFLDSLDENYRKLKQERFECIRIFITDKISHMPEPHYFLSTNEKDLMRTALDSLFSIKEELQDEDK